MMLVSIKNNNSIMDKLWPSHDYVRHVSNNALPTGQKADLSALRLPLSSICLWLFVAFIVFAAAASVAAAVAVWRGVYAPVCSAFCM